MKLAIFDLDNTLISGDSDYAWGNFLVQRGVVDKEHYQKENDRFYEEYLNKTLDIFEYQRFVLKPLSEMNQSQLSALHAEFMEGVIEPLIQPKAQELINQHKQQGDQLLVITATNRFITAPIVKKLEIDNLLATEPEIINGEFTGNIDGVPCFQEGKIKRLEMWLKQQSVSFNHITFYSDSINDAPLLEYAETAIAVDPDDQLKQMAEIKGWKIISLRD